MNIQLVTGKTVSISVYEYLFVLRDDDMDMFYQSCIADDLGIEINNPFSNKASMGSLDWMDSNTQEEKPEDLD